MSVRKKEPTKQQLPKSLGDQQGGDRGQVHFNLQKIQIDLKCKNESQKNLIRLINENTITICSGRAGTGKTFIACAQALKLLKTEKYKKILLVKSVTVLEGEDVGFLKGDLKEKMFPFTISFLDNFYKLIGEDNTTAMLNEGLIEVLPLAYIRGRSIDSSIIIVDEAQNISLKNMRSTLTRIGDNSKMIITGDTKQIDIKNKRLSSLDTVVTIFSGKPNIGTMEFQTKDIVRNPIVMMIEEEFDTWEENQPKNSIKV
jgi:phosphate starvation-inducible PhoH-like protein